jgi:hypothetical protein
LRDHERITTTFSDPPRTAAWQHRDARNGFEVVFLDTGEDGYRIEGHTAAVEDGQAWAVEYVITLDRDWLTKSALVHGRSATGRHELMLEADGAGGWTVNGAPARELDGCLDVDLEASSFTNAFPVHRLGLEVGQEAEAPAAYVRALDLSVERLEQRYAREANDGDRQRYHYTSPAFEGLGPRVSGELFETELVYDQAGLVIDYPGIAVRAA